MPNWSLRVPGCLRSGTAHWVAVFVRSRIGRCSRYAGPEFEQRVAPDFGEVIPWGVVDAYPVSA